MKAQIKISPFKISNHMIGKKVTYKGKQVGEIVDLIKEKKEKNITVMVEIKKKDFERLQKEGISFYEG